MGCVGSEQISTQAAVISTGVDTSKYGPHSTGTTSGVPVGIAPPAGQVRLCKFNCGHQCNPGLPGGKPFDTCCKDCALSEGDGQHSATCPGPPRKGGLVNRAGVRSRPPCSQGGSRCRKRRDPQHLAAESHPLDDDYLQCCGEHGVEPEELTLKVLFDWTDADGSGKLSHQELQQGLGSIARATGKNEPEDIRDISAEDWKRLDEDGNGVVNFIEFASWAGPRLGLPLGLKRQGSTVSTKGGMRCNVLGCPCNDFRESMHCSTRCRTCKHKKTFHKVQTDPDSHISLPSYWVAHGCNQDNLVPVKWNEVQKFQKLLDATYRNILTRDRRRHSPLNPTVPKGYTVLSVTRNENLHLWKEYYARMSELQTQAEEAKVGRSEPIKMVTDVKTRVFEGVARGDIQLVQDCNEWYLFHGTSPSAAASICSTDFVVGRAGENTGTLYGRGLYFAESITKADEYAKSNDQNQYAVLMCRVLGGRVYYTDEVTPDPEFLVQQCVEGIYDSVLGDREKARNTYREFVLFDSEDVYPEFIITYSRNY